jgi:ribonuclease HI
MVSKEVTIHSDGACEGNPGPGGWAAVLQYGVHTKEIAGGEPATTNNRMELLAAISALRGLKERCKVEFYTDSEYLRIGVTEWMWRWKARNWMLTHRKAVKNADLWKQLDQLVKTQEIQWHWLKGHAGHRINERCDFLARQEIAKLKRAIPADKLKLLVEEFSKKGRGLDKQPELEITQISQNQTGEG